MNMKMYRKYNETVLTVNSDVLIFSLWSHQHIVLKPDIKMIYIKQNSFKIHFLKGILIDTPETEQIKGQSYSRTFAWRVFLKFCSMVLLWG